MENDAAETQGPSQKYLEKMTTRFLLMEGVGQEESTWQGSVVRGLYAIAGESGGVPAR